MSRGFGPMENGFRRKRRDLRGREKNLVKGAWSGTRRKVVRVGRCSLSGAPPGPPKLSPTPSDLSLPQFPSFSSPPQVAMPVPLRPLVCLPIFFLPRSSSHDHASDVPPISVFPRPCPYIPSKRPCALLTPPPLCPVPPPSALTTPCSCPHVPRSL